MHHWYLNPWGSPVNAEAQTALLAMGPKAAPYLVLWIKKPPTYGLDFNYPEHALNGFKTLGSAAKPAVPGLIKIIGLNQDYPERALLCIGIDAVPLLADKLVETLSDTNYPFFQGAIRMGVRQDSGFFIRGRILGVLDRMGTNAEAALPALVLTASTNLPVFQEDLYEDNPYKTLAIIGRNHPEIVAPVLLGKFASNELERGKIANAIAVLGTNQASTFMPILIAALSDPKTDGGNRAQIGKAMTEISGANQKDLVSVFLAALTTTNNSEPIRCCMARYLAAVGQDEPDIVIPALLTAYTNSSLHGRSSVAGALASFGDRARSVVPLLLADCEREIKPHNDNGWRIQLAIAAKTIAPDNASTLVPLFKDLEISAGFVRQQTISALARLGTNGVEAVPALLKCLSNSDYQTRIDATRALKNIGVSSEAFIVALGENLTGPNSFMSGEAANTLMDFAKSNKLAFVLLVKNGMIRQPWTEVLIDQSREDPKFMLECLNDSDDVAVRIGALNIFQKLQRSVPDAIPKLRELAASDPNTGVRNQATEVLRLQLQ